MVIRGHVLDSGTKQGISRASITIVDSGGRYLGQGIYSDDDGSFGLSSSLIDNNYVLVSSVGYGSTLVEPSLFAGTPNYEIDLDRDYKELETPVVSPKSKGNYAWLGLVAIGVTATVVETNTRSKKSRVGEIDASKYVLPVGMLVLGAAVAIPLLQKLGLLDDAEDKAKKAAADKAAKEQSDAGTAASTGNRQYSDRDLKTMVSSVATTTDTFIYDYDNLVRTCAYFAGFTSADARRFLGFFVDINGITFYQWYVKRFLHSATISPGGLWSSMQDYLPSYKNMGVDTDSWFINPDTWALSVTQWVYRVAGLSMQ